jgi:CelD/BcsL family acetyltransferase involved in cellulose biosynthesis
MIDVEVYHSWQSCRGFLSVMHKSFPMRNPFLAPEWMETWWKHFSSPGKHLEILVFRAGERLVGYAPLYYEYRRALGAREYRFVGDGVANCLEVVFEPGLGAEVFSSLSEYFVKLGLPIVLSLRDVSDSSPTHGFLRELRGKGLNSLSYFPLYSCPRAFLCSTWEEFFETAVSRSKKRRELRKFEERFHSVGFVEFSVIRDATDLTNQEGMLEEMMELHRRRFRRTLNATVRDEFWSFCRDVVESMAGAGLNLSILRLDGRLVSFVLGFEYGTTFIDYLVAFDPVMERFSLGHVHLMKLMRHLISRGFKIFDFSKGEGVYKRRWARGTAVNYGFLVTFNSGNWLELYRWLRSLQVRLLSWGRRRGYNMRVRKVLGSIAGIPDLLCCRVGTYARGGECRLVEMEACNVGEQEKWTSWSYAAIHGLPEEAKRALVGYRYYNADHEIAVSLRERGVLVWDRTVGEYYRLRY